MPRRSYDRLTTDVRFAKHVRKNARRILRRPTSYLQSHKIMGDIVRKCITIFLSHYRKSILRLTQDNRMINGKMFCKSSPSRALELGFKNVGFQVLKTFNPPPPKRAQFRFLVFLFLLCNLINKPYIQIITVICEIHQFHRHFSHGVLLLTLNGDLSLVRHSV